MITVIGFVGKLKSGKTTAAKFLKEEGYIHLRIADSLKRMLMDGLGIDREYIDGSKKNEPCDELCGATARHAMITLGTEWGRNMIHPDLWVKAAERQLYYLISHGEYKFVIDDIRFLNEANWLMGLSSSFSGTKFNTSLIKLVRNVGETIDHQSETEQDHIKPEYVIFNDNTTDMLRRNVLMTADLINQNLVKKKG